MCDFWRGSAPASALHLTQHDPDPRPLAVLLGQFCVAARRVATLRCEGRAAQATHVPDVAPHARRRIVRRPVKSGASKAPSSTGEFTRALFLLRARATATRPREALLVPR